MRDYLLLDGNLILFVGAFVIFGICAAHDTGGGNPWYGAARGAAIGVVIGPVFGVGMQEQGKLRPSAQDGPAGTDEYGC